MYEAPISNRLLRFLILEMVHVSRSLSLDVFFWGFPPLPRQSVVEQLGWRMLPCRQTD